MFRPLFPFPSVKANPPPSSIRKLRIKLPRLRVNHEKGAEMVSLLCIGIVLFAGIIGGLVNAVLSDNGFIWPRYQDRDGVKILRPGVLGNCLVSAVAAFVSWGLYGPAAAVHLVGATNPTPLPLTLTAGMVAGALLVGIAGARWLTNEVDKDLLRAAAT
jgi:H+/Cl- antiporter ClcA